MNSAEWQYTSLDMPHTGPRWPAGGVGKDAVVRSTGVFCEIKPADSSAFDSRFRLELSLEEFAEFSDGTRLTLDHTRGVGILSHGGIITAGDLPENINAALIPDEDINGVEPPADEKRPWEDYAQVLASVGCHVSADELRGLPSTIEYSKRLEDYLTRR